MRNCPNCGFPVEQQLREDAAKSVGSVSRVSTSVCLRCGAILDPPVVVSIDEGTGGSKNFSKILD